jgi:hypothetical protein
VAAECGPGGLTEASSPRAPATRSLLVVTSSTCRRALAARQGERENWEELLGRAWKGRGCYSRMMAKA